MSLENVVMAKLKEAMKAKDQTALAALRAIKSALLIEKTKSAAQNLTPADEMRILQKLVKQRKESAEIYKSQNRDDLAETEIAQAKVIEQFLPAQLSMEEIGQIVNEIIAQTGAQTMKDMGKVMAIATKKLAGRADSKTISQLVKEKLS